MAIKDYSTDPDRNTTISGINIAEGCAPSGINNAIRQLMADVKTEKEERDVTQSAKDTAQDKAISAAQSGVTEAKQSVTTLDSTLRALIAQEVAKCLNTSGGTMKGGIVFDGVANCISAVGNNPNPIRFMSGSEPYGNGSSITLLPVDYEDPDFKSVIWLRACLGGVNKSWYFYPNGKATAPGGSELLHSKMGNLLNSSNVKIYNAYSATLPAGGTWLVIGHSSGDGHDAGICGQYAGGTTVSMSNYGGVKFILAIKIA